MLREIDLTPTTSLPATVELGTPNSNDPDLGGAKAAALSKAKLAGLPVLPGFVITAARSASIWSAGRAHFEASLEAAVRSEWARLSAQGKRPLVVRSSSTVEDSETSSMAGMFTSVLSVVGWRSFVDAVQAVLQSSERVASLTGRPAPIAVLVQPQLDPSLGGVMFGVDPVSGRRDRLVVSAVRGGPDKLVHGETNDTRYVLRPNGRRIDMTDSGAQAKLSKAQRRALAALAARAEKTFGGPQDIEWAFDDQGDLWLLQSRPITAAAATGKASGPLLGPGPVAETFPDPLSPLEEDLWVQPLGEGLVEALRLSGTVSPKRVARSPVLTTVQGRIAVDLDLVGAAPRKSSLLAKLDPRPPARRLLASWRVGRLRAAMPALARDLLERADADMAELPDLRELSVEQLMTLLRRLRSLLVALHGQEVLAGLLLHGRASASTAASVALRALSVARCEGLSDAQIIGHHPVVLALVPPRIGREISLPPAPPSLPEAVIPSEPLAEVRESLRIRARWAHELGARAATELGRRAQEMGLIEDEKEVRWLRLAELEAAFLDRAVPVHLHRRKAEVNEAPLPAAFRLSPDGEPVQVGDAKPGKDGQGASAGRGVGRVRSDGADPSERDVLVVRHLDPALAPYLPNLAGLVSETGSVLSHLAILARELHVPTVVGVPDAVRRFPPGSTVVVDGAAGEVISAEEVESI